jgi:hypothetical protein
MDPILQGVLLEYSEVLFSCKIFYKMNTVALLFIFDKYYLIID